MNIELSPQHVGYIIDAILVVIALGFYAYCLRWCIRQDDLPEDIRVYIAGIGTIALVAGTIACIVGQVVALHKGYWVFWQHWDTM